MPALTRRRSDNPHRVTWHVSYYGDVRVARSASAPASRSMSIDGAGHAAFTGALDQHNDRAVIFDHGVERSSPSALTIEISNL
jgi:hypothetical protein